MIAPPDALAVRGFLARVSRRLTWIASAEGAAIGLGVAFIVTLVGVGAARSTVWITILGLALAIVAAVAHATWRRARGADAATAVERREPRCRNLLITADELLEREHAGSSHGTRGKTQNSYVGGLVYREAARLVSGLDPAALFPARNAMIAFVAAAALWAAALARPGETLARRASLSSRGANPTAASVIAVDVVVTPPSYTAQPGRTAHDPSRIEALAGSRVRISVRANASSVVVETLHGRIPLAAASADSFSGELLADADGYLAIEPISASGRAGTRRLVGLSVLPDEAPRARITAPGRDLFLRDAHQTIDVAIQADDDIGLGSLRLRYTKVSGSGERFTFTEGEVPLTTTRADPRRWTARASWALDDLGLVAGDMVVYRAVVGDHRPGATPSESDSFIAEILAPGGDAAAGFALDPDQERYAVSQQMVILKTERLAANRASMSTEAFSTAAQEIAAEQRKVRAEFVFMMGGEVADAPDPAAEASDLNEEAEAQGEDDLAAGRMVNQGRIALLRAIRSMSRAATSLTVADLPPALTHERAALTQLERAFSRSRLLLRALTERERLDLSRRLTGTLADVSRDKHPSADPAIDTRIVELRRVLAGIASLAAPQSFAPDAPAVASTLAANVLRVDPSDKALQDVSAQLAAAATSLEHARSGDARRDLERGTTSLAAVLRNLLLDAPSRAPSIDASRLSGALTDALQRQVIRR